MRSFLRTSHSAPNAAVLGLYNTQSKYRRSQRPKKAFFNYPAVACAGVLVKNEKLSSDIAFRSQRSVQGLYNTQSKYRRSQRPKKAFLIIACVHPYPHLVLTAVAPGIIRDGNSFTWGQGLRLAAVDIVAV